MASISAGVSRTWKKNGRRGREDHAQNRETCQNQRERPEQTVGKFPSLRAGTIPHVIGKDGDEGSGHGPLAEQTAQEIRDAVRQNERIGDARGAEEQSQTLIAHVSENATDNRNYADNGSRLEDLPLVGQDVGQRIEAPSLSPV